MCVSNNIFDTRKNISNNNVSNISEEVNSMMTSNETYGRKKNISIYICVCLFKRVSGTTGSTLMNIIVLDSPLIEEGL